MSTVDPYHALAANTRRFILDEAVVKFLLSDPAVRAQELASPIWPFDRFHMLFRPPVAAAFDGGSTPAELRELYVEVRPLGEGFTLRLSDLTSDESGDFAEVVKLDWPGEGLPIIDGDNSAPSYWTTLAVMALRLANAIDSNELVQTSEVEIEGSAHDVGPTISLEVSESGGRGGFVHGGQGARKRRHRVRSHVRRLASGQITLVSAHVRGGSIGPGPDYDARSLVDGAP